MVNIDPIHWACVGLGVALVGLSIYTKVIATELEACQAATAAVEIIGKGQEITTKKDDKESKDVKEKVDETLHKRIASLTATNNRLRHEITSRRSLPSAPQTCTGGGETTKIDWPLVESAVDEFRIEVRGIVEEGDINREGLDSVKEWVDEKLD